MNRATALVTVTDLGAVETILAALSEAGIEATTDRIGKEHPYQASALLSYRVLVDANQVEQATDVLKALEVDVARDFNAQANAAAHASSNDADSRLHNRAARRRSFATIWLGFLVPFPITCLLAGAHLLGTVFLAAFVGALIRTMTYERGTAPEALAWILAGIKLGDLLTAIVVLIWRRSSPPPDEAIRSGS
jgi:hypothetical protein